MANILDAVFHIVESKRFDVHTLYVSQNRANSMGDALEKYVKDAFSGTLLENDEQIRIAKHSSVFSWLGSQNNPPDAMIKNGDAIEVKKIGINSGSIQLNSSYPKCTLENDSPMITNECRECEDWQQKDLIYCVGHIKKERLESLWMFYGNIYSANKAIYERTKDIISNGISSIPDFQFSETNELGRVNSVDPLGITDLRIRGMWQISTPKNVFDYVWKSQDSGFELVVIIPVEKYNTFSQASRDNLENTSVDGFNITDTNVKNPNNPAELIPCKLITFVL